MASLFKPGYIREVKVNSFMTVVKPGEARRQEGNMSAPVDQSFNEGILEGSLKDGRGFKQQVNRLLI